MWGQWPDKREGHPRGVCASRRPACAGVYADPLLAGGRQVTVAARTSEECLRGCRVVMATREQLSGTRGLRGRRTGLVSPSGTVRPFGPLSPPQCPHTLFPQGSSADDVNGTHVGATGLQGYSTAARAPALTPNSGFPSPLSACLTGICLVSIYSRRTVSGSVSCSVCPKPQRGPEAAGDGGDAPRCRAAGQPPATRGYPGLSVKEGSHF